MRIGFTGTRKGMTDNQKDLLRAMLMRSTPDFVFHGGCVGADEEFHELCLVCKSAHPPSSLLIPAYPVVTVYPSDDRLQQMKDFTGADFVTEERPALERNKLIVGSSDILIAAPKTITEELRSGTWMTIRYAWERGVPVAILPP